MGSVDQPGSSEQEQSPANHSHGHRFPPERRHLLKDEERQRWLPAGPILATLGISPGTIAVDIGAGTGFWTLPLSKLVGPAGMVYAVDIEPIMLDELRTLQREEQLDNVQVVSSTELKLPLTDGIAEVAIAGFVIHEPGDPAAFMREIVRLLRPGGRFLVVDWHAKATEKGPPVEHRLAQGVVEDMLTDAGLAVEALSSPNADVYVLLGCVQGRSSPIAHQLDSPCQREIRRKLLP